MKSKTFKITTFTALLSIFVVGFFVIAPVSTSAQGTDPPLKLSTGKKQKAADGCGAGKNMVKVKFDFGCQGNDYKGPGGAIGDLLFTLIRFVSTGVGILVIASIIFSGIQYSTSQGSPEVTVKAKARIQTAVIALVLYMFLYALIQWVVPGGLFAA